MKELDLGVCIPDFKAAGVRQKKYGVAIISSDSECEFAGVYTNNSVKAAPVELMIETTGKIKGLIVNSGNANACNLTGLKDAIDIRKNTADILGIKSEELAVGSTGIIGRSIDVEKVTNLAKKAISNLKEDSKSSLDAASAIMTTDTHPKMFCVEQDGIYVGGICKGAGMIDPTMATLLVYITTNANLEKKELQQSLQKAVDDTFNMISIDGDQSTNDTVLLISNQTKECKSDEFQPLLDKVCLELSKMVAFDGEGCTKKVTIEVTGCESKEDARKSVKAITNSNLVKTALYGSNPNWGRIMAAVGTVIDYDWKKASITYEVDGSSYTIVEDGMGKPLERAEEMLKLPDIKITVDVNQGKKSATGYTCDLSEEYIRINAEYS